MDPITHAVVGLGSAALSGQDFSLTNPVYIASITGAVAPDLDILLRIGGEMTYLKHHRGMTHSLPGLLILSGIITLSINLFFPSQSMLQVFLWVFVGTLSHSLLDILNSYGVKLLWPFSHKSFSLNLLLIYDPLLIILFSAMFYYRHSNKAVNLEGLSIFLLYLLFRYYTRLRVRHYLTLKYRHRKPSDIIVMPSLFSLFTWDFLIETKKEFLIGSIKTYPKGFNLKRKLKKGSKNLLIKAALKTKLASLFKDFTPHFHVYHFQKDGKHFVRFLDLRYCRNKEFLHSATAVFDQKLKLIESIFHPFNRKRQVKLSS